MCSFEEYHYTVEWSEEDDLYVASVKEFSLLKGHATTRKEALWVIQKVVKIVLKDLIATGEPLPKPYSSENNHE